MDVLPLTGSASCAVRTSARMNTARSLLSLRRNSKGQLIIARRREEEGAFGALNYDSGPKDLHDDSTLIPMSNDTGNVCKVLNPYDENAVYFQ